MPRNMDMSKNDEKGECTVKKIFNITVNIIPLFVWMIWFYLALIDLEVNPDLGTIQILLLLGLPLLYSIYNVFFAKDKNEFAIYNAIFSVSHIIGYYIMGLLYYNYISSDSETVLVINTFSGISIIYILIATLIFYGIRVLVDKVRNK